MNSFYITKQAEVLKYNLNVITTLSQCNYQQKSDLIISVAISHLGTVNLEDYTDLHHSLRGKEVITLPNKILSLPNKILSLPNKIQ